MKTLIFKRIREAIGRLRGERIEGACVVNKKGEFLRFSADFIAECDVAVKNYDTNVNRLFGKGHKH